MDSKSSDEEIQFLLKTRQKREFRGEQDALIIFHALNNTRSYLYNFGGSVKGKDANEDRLPDATALEVVDIFFRDPTVKSDSNFRRIYRVPRTVYETVTKAVQKYDLYFTMSSDATGRRGISPVNNFTAAFTMLANGSAAHANEGYLKLSGSTMMIC